jgi:hypothetical protein
MCLDREIACGGTITPSTKTVAEINAQIEKIKQKLKSANELLEYAVKTDTCVGNMMQVHARKTVKYEAQIKSLKWVLTGEVEGKPQKYPWDNDIFAGDVEL